MDRLVLAYTQVCWELPTQYTVDVYIAIAYFMLGAKNVPLADMRQYGVEGLAGKLRSVFSSWRVAREEEFVRSALIYFVSESDAVIGPSFQREVERSVAWGWDELDEWAWSVPQTFYLKVDLAGLKAGSESSGKYFPSVLQG